MVFVGILPAQRVEQAPAPVGGAATEVTRAAALLARGDTNDAIAILLAGAGSRNPATVAAYRADLQSVASPAELAEWTRLPDDGRAPWLAAFWARRDATQGRNPGEVIAEHYRRVALADSEYPRWRSGRDDRGAVLIREGAPDARLRAHHDSVDVWAWGRSDEAVIVGFTTRNQSVRIQPIDLDADHAIREPLCRADRSLCAGRPLLAYAHLHSAAVDDACDDCRTLLDSLHHIPSHLQRDTEQPAEEDRKIADDDLYPYPTMDGAAAVRLVTTTDAFPRSFSRIITPRVEAYDLARTSSGRSASRIVVACAVPARQLMAYNQKASAAGRVLYPLQFHVAAARDDGAEFSTDTTRTFVVTDVQGGNIFMETFVELTVPPGTYRGSLTVTQEQGRGGTVAFGPIAVPGSSDTLAISSLVFGRPDLGVKWDAGGTPVTLDPLNLFPVKLPVQAYFQASGLTPGTTYQIGFAFYRADRDTSSVPAMSVRASELARSARLDVNRSLVIANLEPGEYRVTVTVSGGGRQVAAERRLEVVKK